MTKPRLLPVSPARQLMPASQLTSSLGIDKGTIANDEMERRPLLKLAPPSLVGAGNGKAACCAPSVVDGQLMLHDPVDGKSMNDRQRSGSYPRDVYGGGGRAYGSMGDCVGKHSDGGSSEDDTGVHSALQVNS